MLHVILTILAVIGIIILCMLGLIILIASLVLFWPVKYRINASYYEKKYTVNVKVYWLLGAICDKMKIDNDGFNNEIKALWFKIGEEKPDKKSKKKPEAQARPKVQKPLEESQPSKSASAKEPEVLKRIRAEKAKEDKKPKDKKTKEKKQPIFERIKAFFIKLKERYKTISGIIKDKNNKRSFRFLKKQLFYLLKKIRPRKIKADIIFGLGDPALTGQALGAIAVLMGIIGTGFAIQPDFENQIIQGDIEIRGRLFIFTLVLIALRIYRNKGLRRSYKKLKQVKF